jgi:uncharacterized membrane protein YbhN (UPF0104 family)
VIKVTILIGAAYFIYDKLMHNSQLGFETFLQQLASSQLWNPVLIFGLLLMTFANWFVEIVKWKTLVSAMKKISLWESAAHSLGGLTASLFTPNRVGEYGAKALYFQKAQRKRVVGLNFLGNVAQLIATVLFGMIGSIFFVVKFKIELPWFTITLLFLISGIILTLLMLIAKQKRFQLQVFSWERIRGFLRSVSGEIHLKNLGFALIRYLIFSHQLYLLLICFGLHTSYLIAMSAITTMYLISSLIPMLSIFDVVVKGSVAILLFGYLNIPELAVLSVVSLMWILNFVLPSIVGSYFVLNFKLPASTEKQVIA